MHLLPDGASSLLCLTSVIFSSVIHCGSGYKLRENYGFTGMSELGPSGTRHKGLMNRVLHFQPASQNSGFSWFSQDFIDTRVKQLTGAIHAVPLPLFPSLRAICTIHTLLVIGTVSLPSQPGADGRPSAGFCALRDKHWFQFQFDFAWRPCENVSAETLGASKQNNQGPANPCRHLPPGKKKDNVYSTSQENTLILASFPKQKDIYLSLHFKV